MPEGMQTNSEFFFLWEDDETGKDIHEINLKVDKLDWGISSGGIDNLICLSCHYTSVKLGIFLI